MKEIKPSAHIKTESITEPNKILIPLEKITIKFNYPLTNPTEMEFTSLGGFTRKAFLHAIHEGYKKIYSAEKDPGELPNSYNRATSSGPYGIWGHYLGDLYLEGYSETSGKVELSIGS